MEQLEQHIEPDPLAVDHREQPGDHRHALRGGAEDPQAAKVGVEVHIRGQDRHHHRGPRAHPANVRATPGDPVLRAGAYVTGSMASEARRRCEALREDNVTEFEMEWAPASGRYDRNRVRDAERDAWWSKILVARGLTRPKA